jgi:hypothetical protein
MKSNYDIFVETQAAHKRICSDLWITQLPPDRKSYIKVMKVLPKLGWRIYRIVGNGNTPFSVTLQVIK